MSEKEWEEVSSYFNYYSTLLMCAIGTDKDFNDIDDIIFNKDFNQNFTHYESTWIINPSNKKITAKVVDGKDRFTISYNSSIVLLPTVLKEYGEESFFYKEYYFDGWHEEGNKKIIESKVVYKDTAFKGKWTRDSNVKAFALACVVLFIILIIIVGLIIVASFYIRGYKKRKNEKKKLRDLLYPKVYDEQESDDSLNRMEGLYPEGYTSHGEIKIREALRNAGLNEKLTSEVMSKCYDNARRLGEEDNLPKNITVDDAAALAMYTFDFGTKDLYPYNPYRIINSALSERNEENLEKAKDLLYLVMKALRKLPVVFGTELHRGIRADVIAAAATANGKKSAPQGVYDPGLARMGQGTNKPSTTYEEGNVITWNALSSTSPDMNVTKTFLAGGTKAGNAAGTLFIVSNGWGYDIQPYSLFPTETEILVEPERKFRVIGTVKGELTIIKLEMLKTPVILPGVFGKHDLRVSPIYLIEESVDEYEKKKRKKMMEEQNNRRKSMPPPPKDRKQLELDEIDMI